MIKSIMIEGNKESEKRMTLNYDDTENKSKNAYSRVCVWVDKEVIKLRINKLKRFQSDF